VLQSVWFGLVGLLVSDERLLDITMWKEELLAEIRADEVEMDNMKVRKIYTYRRRHTIPH